MGHLILQVFINLLGPNSGGGFTTHLDLFHAYNVLVVAVDGVVHHGEVLERRSLSNSSELVVDGAVTDAHVPVVRPEVGDGDATEMGAHGGVDCHKVLSHSGDVSSARLIKKGASWVGLFLLYLLRGQSPDEGRDSVPGDLDYLT